MNELIGAIAEYLTKLFPGIKVYTEQIPQDAPASFFFVDELETPVIPMLGPRSMRTISLDIRYHGKTNKEMRQIRDSLLSALDRVPFGAHILAGRNINSNMVDRVQHILVDFDLYFIRKEIKPPFMQKMTERFEVHE